MASYFSVAGASNGKKMAREFVSSFGLEKTRFPFETF